MSQHSLLSLGLQRLSIANTFAAFFVVLASIALYRTFFHPLRKIPGPLLASISGLWRVIRFARGQWHDDILALHEQYGPVVRIAPNEVSFVDKEASAEVYGHTNGTRKTAWYDVWAVKNAGTGFFNATDPKEHAFLRKRVATAYSMSTMLSLEPQIQEIADAVWMQFRKIAEKGQTIDLQTWTCYFAFDVVGKLGLGGPIGFVETCGDVNSIMQNIHGFFYLWSVLGNVPGQKVWVENPLSRAVLGLLAPQWVSGGPKFQAWLFKQVGDRMAEGEVKDRTPDMLDHFISMKDPDGSRVSFPGVAVEGGNLIGAGADTTAIAIAVVVGQLLVHPDDLQRVQQEVDEVYAQHDKEWQLDYKTAEKLPWLSSCIKEATRMCPSILWPLPREAPAAGITIAGNFIPPGSELSISTIAHNRCREIFGDDANEWRPSRWIADGSDASSEYLRGAEKFNALFGFGSRVCMGRHLAMIEVHKFVGQLVRQFDLILENPQKPFVRRSQWFCLQEKLLVRLKKRDL